MGTSEELRARDRQYKVKPVADASAGTPRADYQILCTHCACCDQCCMCSEERAHFVKSFDACFYVEFGRCGDTK